MLGSDRLYNFVDFSEKLRKVSTQTRLYVYESGMAVQQETVI